MRPLVIIPARGGSKGIPHKNIKELGGKPLICYAIDAARKFTTDDNICVSTDDEDIIKVVEKYGLSVPFKRPDYLATDNAGTNGVLLHALNFYEEKGFAKPVRCKECRDKRKAEKEEPKKNDIEEMLAKFRANTVMIEK